MTPGRHRVTWGSGDYAVIGTTFQIVGETLCESADLRTDEAVLDVAAGNGNASLAAARRGCQVVSTDLIPELLARGAERATAEHLSVEFQVADAEALPFEAERFDAVLSVFGAMFALQPQAAAAELVRVCKRGGRIALASWTPEGFVGQMFQAVGAHLPPPTGARSPAQWGTEDWIGETFGPTATEIAFAHRFFNFRYRSAAHWIEVFRACYGPLHKAFAVLRPPMAAALEADLSALLDRFNRGGPASLIVPAEYLEVVIERR